MCHARSACHHEGTLIMSDQLDLDHLARVCEAVTKSSPHPDMPKAFYAQCPPTTVLSIIHRFQAAEKREDQLEVCLANILHADARGQGLPFKEAMDRAHELLMYSKEAP